MSVRCTICDWSPSNKQSLYNSELDANGYNKLFHDDKTNQPICHDCISSVYQQLGAYVKGFKAIEHEAGRGHRRAIGEDSYSDEWSDMPKSGRVQVHV